ncbi:hypothetical protein K492DRAFT_50449 [Lichtheimia hyalospora FSU 10163]|nr:hypothetical protein K492DRAFT_50449 [Lichtheimia hyalospora FSU 10163]
MIDGRNSTENKYKQPDDDGNHGGDHGGESNIDGYNATYRGDGDASTPRSNTEQDQASNNSPTRTQAAFINKLYRMLEDSTIRHLICWSENGDLFSVTNPTVFSRTVLPQYFKHNNWQSFVRQLNMYGFHKVNDMIYSNLSSDNQNWEFRHPSFRRGAVEELKNIKRKSVKSRHQLQAAQASSSTFPGGGGSGESDDYLFGSIYRHLVDVEDRVRVASHAYELLVGETNALRSVIAGQQEVINDIADMIMTLASDEPAQQMRVETIRQQLSSLSSLRFDYPQTRAQHQQQQPYSGMASESSTSLPRLSNITYPLAIHPLTTKTTGNATPPPHPHQQQRLPSIGSVGANLPLEEDLTAAATMLRPPVAIQQHQQRQPALIQSTSVMNYTDSRMKKGNYIAPPSSSKSSTLATDTFSGNMSH